MPQITFDDLAALRSLQDPRPSPDGRHVAFVVSSVDVDTDRDVTSVWIVSTVKGEARPLTRGPNDQAPAWLDDSTLSFMRTKDEGADLCLLRLDGGEPETLFSEDGGIVAYEWSPDRKRLAFTSYGEARAPSSPAVIENLPYKLDDVGLLGRRALDLFRFDLADRTITRLTDCRTLVGAPSWSPDGRSLAFAASIHEAGSVEVSSDLYRVPADATGASEPEQITKWNGMAGRPVWCGGGETVLFVGVPEPTPAAHHVIFTVPASGGVPIELFAGLDRNVLEGGPGYPGAPLQATTEDTLLFCVREDGGTRLLLAPFDESSPPKTLFGGNAVVTAAGLDPTGRWLAVVASTPRVPSELVFVDPTNKSVTSITSLNSFLRDRVHHDPEMRFFTAPDGMRITGWLRGRDPQRAPQPLLVDVHGGPHNAWNDAFDGWHLYHHVLADRGWIVLTLNPRGSDGYGHEFFEAVGKGGWGISDEADFLSTIDTLVDEGAADPRRLAVAGYSYGGYMAAWLVGRTNRFAAAIAGGAVVDLLGQFGGSDVGSTLLWKEWGVRPWEAPERYREMSPSNRAHLVATPTLLLHGERDLRCPVGQAEEFFSLLRTAGVPARLVVYPDASHAFPITGRPSHRRDYQERIVEWLHAHAGGLADGA